MANEFKLTVVHVHAKTRLCMSVDLPPGKNMCKMRARPRAVAGRRGPPGRWAVVGRGPLSHGPAFNKTLLTQQQLDLELPQILAGESDSELNGEYTYHSHLTVN